MGGPKSSSNNSNGGGISDVPMTGRELAIEALIDLDPRGPLYRINRILSEDTNAAISARPNKITKSALLDAALMLSKYQYKCGEYPQHYHHHNNQSSLPSSEVENSKSYNTTDNDSNKSAVELFKEQERDPLSKSQRERVMRHLVKIILAKSKENNTTTASIEEGEKSKPKADDDKTKHDDENVQFEPPPTSLHKMSVSVYPPPQIVTALRKIYGSPSSDCLDELEDSDNGGSISSESSVLPSLIQSIVDHPVFTTKILPQKDDEGDSIVKVEMKKANTEKDDDEKRDIFGENEVEDSQHLFNERKSCFPNPSPVMNLEALVGNACSLASETSSSNGDNDNLVGVLIAALSVLTSCITTSTIDDDIEASSVEPIMSDIDDKLHTLQVGGPLSLHVDTLKYSPIIRNDQVLKSQSFSDLLLVPSLMNYFIDAASTYEDQEEIKSTQKGVAKVIDKAESNSVNMLDAPIAMMETNVNNEKGIEANTETPVVDNGNETVAILAELENDYGDDQEVQEPPHGYSFIEDDDDDDDDHDDDDHDDDDDDDSSQEDDDSSQEDDNSRVTASSVGEHEEGDDEVHQILDDSTNYDQVRNNNNELFDLNIPQTDEEATLASAQVKAGMNERKNANEENFLSQAIALSYSDAEHPLPHLATYPEKQKLPKDPRVLNPASINQFGKVSAFATFATLLRLALVQSEKQDKRSSACSLSMHTIIAILCTLSTSRMETTKVLTDLVKKLDELNGNGRKYTKDISEDISEVISEDEDPAFATTLVVASAHSTSESLEEKGMIRKAAAAAHSVSIQQEKLQQDIGKAKKSLRFYSVSSYLAMKCLRNIIQHIELSPIYEQSYKLSVVARVRLTACLSNYLSSGISLQLHSLSSYFNDIDDTCIPRTLFVEAALLWGECTPFIFSTTSDFESQLQRSLRQCFPTSFDENASNPELNSQKDIVFPWSEADTNYLKMNSLCQRMRCQEILDYFITAPKVSSNNTNIVYEQKCSYVSVYKTLARICWNHGNRFDPSITANVSGLFYAFHARCTQDLLLWKNVEASAFKSSFNESIESKESVDGESRISAVKKDSFHFDAKKCADSIALIPSNSSNIALIAHQRASKVWGTAFGTTSFEPKSGVHRWAVKLNKCERGHVFVGVATSRASKSTYVGGDKHGWGVIGTQALWHERRKVRSDYGNTFRTGATVVVTLDTDSGTLRFGILHDSEHLSRTKKTSAFNIDRSPLYDGQSNDTFGYIEDWGIAFEGLPLDTKLFPVVGLYQRDDKVTLLSVSSGFNDSFRGSLFYPEKCKPQTYDEVKKMETIDAVRKWNSSICDDGITFVSHILNTAIHRLQSQKSSISDDSFFHHIFPSVISALSLYPVSIPVLSGRFSMTLLPLLCKCLHLVEEKIESSARFLPPVQCIKAGKWIIRAAPCSSGVDISDGIEEYVVNLEHCKDKSCFKGNGIGTGGKSARFTVAIVGAAYGSSIQFVEEWGDESDVTSEANLSASSCVVEATLNIFGTKFEGQYTNVHCGKSGSISGMLENSCELPAFEDVQQCLVSCSAILGMAISHMSAILSSGAPKSDVGAKMNHDLKITKDHLQELEQFVNSSPILSKGFTIHAIDDSKMNSCTQSVLSHFFINKDPDLFSYWRDLALPYFIQSKEIHDLFFIDDVCSSIAKVDNQLAPLCGGYGSLSILEPEVYKNCRQKIISVLLHHTGQTNIESIENKAHSELSHVWYIALQIIETGVRSALLHAQDGMSRKKVCIRYCKLADSVSHFLLQIVPLSNSLEITFKSIPEIYAFASRQKDVICFAEIMESRIRRDLLRFLELSIIQNCVNGDIQTVCTMESLISCWQQSNREIGRCPRNREKSSSMASNHNSFSGDKVHQRKFHVLSSMSLYTENLLNANTTTASLQSLSIAILPSLFVVTKNNVLDFPGDSTWNLIRVLMIECQKVIDDKVLNEDNVKGAKAIHKSMQFHTSLNIMDSITSVLHLFLYQIHNNNSFSIKDDIIRRTEIPMKILKDELMRVMEMMKTAHKSNIGDWRLQQVGLDCDLWITENGSNADYCIERSGENDGIRGKFSVGISFISVRNVEAATLGTQAILPPERYFVRLLNILSSLAHSKIYPYWIQKDDEWIDLLTNCVICNEWSVVSIRLRLRVIRLLRLILPNATPSAALIHKLFSRIGTILFAINVEPTESPEVEYIEAKELISLLRTLHNHSKCTEGELHWCDSIYKAIESNTDASFRGFQAYLGGIPDKVAVGSCVLLKPSAAASITAASSQSKSKSVFESIAPVAASGGAEGIIAGLCRRDALAGRISDVDVKSGFCEIVLFERQGEMEINNRLSSGSISIRAVKVPCQDIVAADEIALLIDKRFLDLKMISNPLIQGVNVITTALCQTEVKKSDNEHLPRIAFEELTNAIFSTRVSSVVLSNADFLKVFLKDKDIQTSDCMKKLLSIASFKRRKDEILPFSSSACDDSLGTLAEHHARFWYLRGLLSEVIQRKTSFNTTRFEKLFRISIKCAHDKLETPIKEISDENEFVTPPDSSRADHITSSDVIDETSQRREHGTERTAFLSNSAESTNDEENNMDDTNASRITEETEAAHLREAAIVQMAELGLPRSWSEYALRQVGGSNIEAAVHFCLERGGDIERLLIEEEERNRRSSPSSNRRPNAAGGSSSGQLLRQLVEMGFPPNWCAEALSSTGHNLDEALTWMIRNGERLSAMDEGIDNMDEGDDDDDDESDEDGEISKAQIGTIQNEEKKQNKNQQWQANIVCPLRSISGRTKIDHKTLEISGLPSGGFSSVGMKGVSLETGKWYYEAELITDGCLQIGWADSSFSGHCQAERGDGCGDGPSSWAFDGWRRYRWHSTATEWGCRWRNGDIVGCFLDMDNKEIRFTLNGHGEDIGMGLAFSGDGFRPCGGVYACVSFNRKEKLRLILGESGIDSFNFPPPPGYKGVGEAVHHLVEEREALVKDENILIAEDVCEDKDSMRNTYLCDFSDGEHGFELFAWQHRFYGSDASVHLGRQGQDRNSYKRRGLGASLQSAPKTIEDVYSGIVSSRLAKEWTNKVAKGDLTDHELIVKNFNFAYDTIINDIQKELSDVGLAICILYTRKLIMHLIIALSSDFDISIFLTSQEFSSDVAARKLLTVIERCCGLHAAGWTGEAGAMAVASEALGLAISGHERNGDPFSLMGMRKYNIGKNSRDNVHLPSAGLSQFLSTAKLANEGRQQDKFDPSLSLASCAEAALGGDVGGSIIFIKNALQNSIIRSASMVRILLAKIRQDVRLLSSVEGCETPQNFSDSDNEDDDDDDDHDGSHGSEGKYFSDNDNPSSPDARLILFLTGLLLSKPVSLAMDRLNSESLTSKSVASSLFLTWSVGLLSASAPWRMICAMTISSIVSICPESFCTIPSSLSTINKYYARFYSTVSRRIWAERSSVPICSRYVQSFVDLSCSIRNAISTLKINANSTSLPTFARWVDAATPISLSQQEWLGAEVIDDSWEFNEGWVSCDAGWEVWTGELEYHCVDWMTPSRSAVRSLTDGGDGPPMLRVGCTVIRGLDWDQEGSGSNNGNEDGKDLYDKEKERMNETKEEDESTEDGPSPSKKKSSPKLPIGTVQSIEPWKGIPGAARRVKWHLTNEEGVYRFGGDGGRYDIAHVDVNARSTRITKRHPLPESLEQCSARYGFGINRKFSIILRLQPFNDEIQQESKDEEIKRVGILEMPDFGAGILVECQFYEDGAIAVTERRLLYGSQDSGWQPRFGQPSYVPGTTIILTRTNSAADLDEYSHHEMLLGSSSYTVPCLRNRANGDQVRVTSELRLLRDKSLHKFPAQILTADVSSPQLPPIKFDSDFYATAMNLSHDRRTLTCTASDGRCMAFGSVGFTKGIHYWEIKIEQADVGSIFIGVAEKPLVDTSAGPNNLDYKSRLNRWLGCGFVNFRATFCAGSERVYGAHYHAGDTIGVLLDCDAGRLSFFLDGVKYGEHIMNDLGCAYENISPFGFNADGCGSSGAGQGAPDGSSDRGRSRSGSRYPSNGAVQPKALWPVVGMRHVGDRVTFSSKWMTSYGVDPSNILKNALAVDETFYYYECISKDSKKQQETNLPKALVAEAYGEYNRWRKGRWQRFCTRGSGAQNLSSYGLDILVDTSPLACAIACASIGLKFVLLPGDRVKVKRSNGRLLELPEEAIIIGAHQGKLWYQIIAQKSEGGSLSEGGGRAWFWDESEVVDDSLQVIGESKVHHGIKLPSLNRFKYQGGLKIIFSEGAVVRLDLEIFDGSEAIGTIPQGAIIPCEDVLERRINSCGVVRFRVRVDDIGVGWISSRIRGGREDAIVEYIPSSNELYSSKKQETPFASPRECAELWLKNYKGSISPKHEQKRDIWSFSNQDEFTSCLQQGIINGMSPYESDSFLTSFITAVSNCSSHGNGVEVSYDLVSSILYTSINIHDLLSNDDNNCDVGFDHRSEMDSSIASMFVKISTSFPSMKSLLARIAMLRAFNRRVKYALPWLLSRPPQESSSVLGGLVGFGASIDRCGKSQQDVLKESWVQASSTGGRIRDFRSIMFDSVKRQYLQSIMDATTTPTPLSHDEYELPREVRTIRVNRVKARNAMSLKDNTTKKKYSIFSQLQNEIGGWSGAALRRGHVAKGHGGQKRAFKVKLIGEGVNDYSGPYREVFADALREVTSVESSMCSALGVLEPSPNQVSDIGEDRNLFMFACPSANHELSESSYEFNISNEERLILSLYSSYVISKTEDFRDTEESISFLGRLASTAVRHGILVDLPLPLGSVWGPLCEEKYNELESLKELDFLSSRYLAEMNRESKLLIKQKRMLNAFADGISSIMPIEVFSIFSATQLMDFYCGSPDIDVDLLQRIVEYEGYNKTDQIIKYFWEVLREMTSDERKLFLQFVWARNRLPLKESDFEDPFKILKDTKSATTQTALPSASTCFFSLTLPQYSDKETLRQKLLFAINNVTTMESDYVTNDAEVREGWRGM